MLHWKNVMNCEVFRVTPFAEVSWNFDLILSYFRLSGSGKDQFGRARYSKSPELIETTFSMSTIEEEQEIALSLKSVDG